MRPSNLRPLALALLLGSSLVLAPSAFAAGEMQSGVKDETLQADTAKAKKKSTKAAKRATAPAKNASSGNASAQPPHLPASPSNDAASNPPTTTAQRNGVPGSTALTPTPPGRGDPPPPGVTDPPAPGSGVPSPNPLPTPTPTPNSNTSGGTGSSR